MIKANMTLPFSSATAPKQIGWDNQDTHLCVKGNAGMAAAVLDGIGGTPDGQKASIQAAKFLFHNLNMMDYRRSPDEIAERLQRCLQGADHHLKQLAAMGRLHSDAGTTAVVAAVLQPTSCNSPVRDVAVAWAGDSRCYAYLPDNTLRSLTIDNDSGMVLVGWNMIRSRMVKTNQSILSRVTRVEDLDTQESKRAFLNRNIVDAVLNLSDSEIQEILQKTQPGKAASILLEHAKRRSQTDHLRAKPDDITCVEISLDPALRL